MNYDPYINTYEGQALYKGVLADEGDVMEEDANEPKDLYAYLISKGLTKRKKRKRGDPVDVFLSRKDFMSSNTRNISSQGPPPNKTQTFNKFNELSMIYDRTDIDAPPMAVINSRINDYFERQNTKEYLRSFLHFRRGLEAKLNEGYKIVRHDPNKVEKQLSKLNAKNDLGAAVDEADRTTALNDTLSRVPSQKLSTYIRRRNNARRR